MKKGSEAYKALLDEALELHLNKNQGYSASNPDAWANFRLAEGLGLTPVQGVLVRLGDKFARVQNLAKDPDNDKVGESLRETLIDLSAYALIAVCLMEERAGDAITSKLGSVAESPSSFFPHFEGGKDDLTCCNPVCDCSEMMEGPCGYCATGCKCRKQSDWDVC